MGLLYQFPTAIDPLDDRVSLDQEEGSLKLKSYGLPYIFWGYMAAIDVVIVFMYLAIRGPLDKMLAGQDQINSTLALSVYALLAIIPLSLFALFFYEKCLTKKGQILEVKSKLFGVPIYKRKYRLSAPDAFHLTHFLDSPNVAKINDRDDLKGFQNRGYHQLFFSTQDGKKIYLDRHSQAGELKKVLTLLSSV